MNIKQLMDKLSRKHLIGLAAAGGAILIAVILMSGPEKPARPVQPKKPAEMNLLGNTDVEKANWRATAEKDLETLKTRQQEIAEQLRSLTEQTKWPPVQSRGGGGESPVLIPPGMKDFPPMPPFPPLNGSRPPTLRQPLPPAIPPMPPSEPIRIFGPEAGAFAAADTGKGKPVEDKQAQGRDLPYLPSGSFVTGILLSGLDAPAGVTASKEPHPVLIKLADPAVLPNRFRLDIKDCFIVGEGYGDLSSERAYIRTTTLSCVRNNGKSVDVPLKGFVAGEDGKVGLRGRVVSKEGLFLGRALVAGFAQGLSDVFSLSATTLSVSPLGATQTVDPGKALKAGALSGAGQAMDRLAQYYIEMAQRVFPVIEIDAGRKVDVVVLQGRPIEPVSGMEVTTR